MYFNNQCIICQNCGKEFVSSEETNICEECEKFLEELEKYHKYFDIMRNYADLFDDEEF